jgi:hypothetical protein
VALSDANRDRFRQIAASARGIPGQLGLRPYTVAIIIDTWFGSDDHVGSGTSDIASPVPITEAGGQPPKVAFDSEDPLAKPTCTIGPITPPYAGGGTALNKLVVAAFENQAPHVLLTGPGYPQGARFAVIQVRTDKALHWTLVCEHADFQPVP